MQVSRPTVDLWIQRFEAEHCAGLADKSRVPHTTPRKVWLPLMIEIYHLQKRHPDAGEFRLWSLLANATIAVRTVGRVMALNKQVYDDIPHVPHPQAKKPPGPHPYKASQPHQYWFIDGRMMDFALDGIKWWSLILLDGYSRTIVAGAMAPSEASWAALLVLYTACLRYGTPQTFISDSGGAYISKEFEAACDRLEIDHQTIVSTHGESDMNLMVTVDRRIPPPTAVPERGVIVSSHTAPQYPGACHAYLAGDSPRAPVFSHHGSAHGALANWCSANLGDH